ncbi:reverse transcriptase domain-containing protein [Tanacetum coccineum]|uniref:Reverse transcriptase domain-containing protein n=1 Tax=Tanacetum coccineum TaxID=301880 RepID=A0ABQ4YNU0_9ASTR
MTSITSAWPFSQWGIDIVGPLPTAPGVQDLEGLALEENNLSYGKQFAEGTFPVFCKKLGTLQAFTSVYHPQANGLVEVTNREIVKRHGTKTRNGTPGLEISVETKRVQDFDSKENEKRRQEDLDVLEERREMAAIKEAHYKQKLEGYYNKNVKPSTFKPKTYVLRLNSASKAEYQGKMGPMWEVPYRVRKAYGDGAYKLETLSGEAID